MSNTKQPKTSGLGDIKTRLDNIAKKDDAHQESTKLDSQLEGLKEANQDIKGSIIEVRAVIAEMKDLTGSVRSLVNEALSYLRILREELSSIKAITFQAKIDDKSLAQIRQEHRNLAESLKTIITDFAREVKGMASHLQYELSNVLRDRGIWLSPGSLKWIAPFAIGSFIFTAVKIVLWAIHLFR